jgi:tRNA(Phe) wybutosine-synthesizing methylase Tyw3
VRDLQLYNEQTDAVVRGDNSVANPESLLQNIIDQSPCSGEIMYPSSSNEGAMECSNNSESIQPKLSSSEFIVKYSNNTVTCVQPGSFFIDQILNRDLSGATHLTEIEQNNGNRQEMSFSMEEQRKSKEIFGEEQLKVTVGSEISLNVLDEPLFPDFSLSVLRFQEAIESFTQAVFSDAYESLNSEEENAREFTKSKEEKIEDQETTCKVFPQESCEGNFDLRENDTQSCELFGENTVKLYEPLEVEIVEEYFESQTAALCGDLHGDVQSDIVPLQTTSFPNLESIDGFENTGNKNENNDQAGKVVSEKSFIGSESVIDNKTETIDEGHEQPKAILTFTEIPILRAHSDSAALRRDDNVLSITDISEQGCLEDFPVCSPIIQEVDDAPERKLVKNHESIILEEITSSDSLHFDQCSSGKTVGHLIIFSN